MAQDIVLVTSGQQLAYLRFVFKQDTVSPSLAGGVKRRVRYQLTHAFRTYRRGQIRAR